MPEVIEDEHTCYQIRDATEMGPPSPSPSPSQSPLAPRVIHEVVDSDEERQSSPRVKVLTGRPKYRIARSKLAILFLAWYAMSGIADGINANIVRKSNFIILPCCLTFAMSYLLCRLFRAEGATWPSTSSIKAGAAIAIGFSTLLGSMYVWDMQHTYAVKTSEAVYTTLIAKHYGESVKGTQIFAIILLCIGSMTLALTGTNIVHLYHHPLGLVVASISNLALSFRTVYAKDLLDKLTPVEVFRDVSVTAAVLLVPLSIVELVAHGMSYSHSLILLETTLSGFCYFAYNCFGFAILELVSSSTYAVGKEMRCLCVYLWTLIWTKTELTGWSAFGVLMVILGSFLYGSALGVDSFSWNQLTKKVFTKTTDRKYKKNAGKIGGKFIDELLDV